MFTDPQPTHTPVCNENTGAIRNNSTWSRSYRAWKVKAMPPEGNGIMEHTNWMPWSCRTPDTKAIINTYAQYIYFYFLFMQREKRNHDVAHKWCYYIPENVSFREYYVFVSNATAAWSAAASHNFVSAITFEGFKLRSSNLTHALLIQISRTSSIIDLSSHPRWPPAAILSKKFKKKSSVWMWNGQKCHRKWISDIQNGRRQPFCQKFPKKTKVAYRSEMARNAIESEMAILSKISKKNNVAYRCEMDRNEIESDFRASKMAVGSPFVKQIQNN